MSNYHPEILRELGRLRQVKAMDDAARERMLASACVARPNRVVRWLAVTVVALTPIALVMVWLLIAR